MNYYIRFDEAGNLTELRPQPSNRALEGYLLVENAPDNLSGLHYYWNGFELVPYSPAGIIRRRNHPGPGFRWSPVDEDWIDERPIEEQLASAWASIRAERDRLLAESDWRVAKAMEMGEPLDPQWAAYRQALRDITTVENPSLVVWPVAPA